MTDPVVMIDVSVPGSPAVIGQAATLGGALRVAAAGDRIYAAEAAAGMEVFRVCGYPFRDDFESGSLSACWHAFP